jgi:hypothetical protein
MPAERLKSALDCVGLRASAEGIVSDLGDLVASKDDARRMTLVLAEACVSYGAAQPLESFSGNAHASRVRADARRYAETCMKDADLLKQRLARPVNKIGSTAEEYGRGDLDSALLRGPFDVAKNLMRRLTLGLPPGEDAPE